MIHALAKRARALGVSESQARKAILTRCLLMQFPLFVVVGVIKKLPKKKKEQKKNKKGKKRGRQRLAQLLIFENA